MIKNDLYSYAFYRYSQKAMSFNYAYKNIDTSTKYSLSKLRRCQHINHFLDKTAARTSSRHFEV